MSQFKCNKILTLINRNTPMSASLLEQFPIQNKNSSDTVRRAVSQTLPSIITGYTFVSRVSQGPWLLMFTHHFLNLSIYNKLNTANAVNSQISTLADKCTELNDNFYTHMIFSTLLFEYNNLLMAFNSTQTKSTAFFHPTNTYSYWFFIRTAQRPALQPRQLGLAVGSNTSASSSLSQSLITRFLCSLWFAFFEAVSYRRKNTQT